jgi:dGTPase
LGNSHSVRINTMVTDIINTSWEAHGPVTAKKPVVRMSPKVLAAAGLMRDFLFAQVYTPSGLKPEALNARATVLFLWNYFNTHETELPPEIRLHADTRERGVADYIASMTDQYALRLAEDLK